MHVHIPKHYGKDGNITENWERSVALGLWHLTEAGISQIRDEIRKELKWRYERQAHYTAWVTGVIGILGAIVGFIAGALSKF